MAATNRADLIVRTHQVLKRHFKPVHPPKRSVFEHMLYACCLENSGHDAAEEAFSRLRDQYIDWNEIRVSTTLELTEVIKCLNDPEEAATRIKRVLQGVFEAIYSFELDGLTKENIGQAAKKIRNFDGTTPFVVAYVIQQGLAGHAIPVNSGLLESFRILGVISDSEAAKGAVPGLERAIPKNHGVEIGSILHNLGVLFCRNPYSPAVRKLLLEIVPDCKDRLPKRLAKKTSPPESPAETEPEPTPAKKTTAPKTAASTSKKESAAAKKTAKKSAAKPSAKKALPAHTAAKKGTAKKPTTKKSAAKKSTTKKPAAQKPVRKKKAAKKSTQSKQTAKKPTTKKSASHSKSKKTSQKKPSKKTGKTTRKTATKKSETKKLSKRKPR